jgi:hypothetical protein
VWVISYPKSGRTWHRALVGVHLARVGGLDLRGALEPAQLCRRLQLPVIDYDHNDANFIGGLMPGDPKVANPQLWEGRKVVLLTRDIRDVLTSAFFHARYRAKVFDGELSDFIRDPKTGAEKILVAFNRWHENRDRARDWMHLRYEDMHRDPEACLRSTLAFAGFPLGSESDLEGTISFCRAENMKLLERDGFFESNRLSVTSDPDGLGAKVRSAKVGDHLQHMSAGDLEFIADTERRLGNPFS